MDKLIIAFGVLVLNLGISVALTQTQLDDTEESKMMLMLEYVLKEHMIKPIEARITDRYISENIKGAKAIVIKCNRSGLYSDKYIKEKLHEFI